MSDDLQTIFEQSYGSQLPDVETLKYKDRLVKFFDLLMKIDRRTNITGTYDKSSK